ncbi:MAG: hypothetical protein M3Q49_09335 [Actinomycetota bacterium]|nr:hypothetical protein [Actinomycetota bacterium]
MWSARLGRQNPYDASAVQPRRTFHVTLQHLRRALGGSGWIVCNGGRYAFDRSLDYWSDAEVFSSPASPGRGSARI